MAVVVEYVTNALSWNVNNFRLRHFIDTDITPFVSVSLRKSPTRERVERDRFVENFVFMYLCNKRVVHGAAVSSALHEGIGTYFLTIIMSLAGT